RCLDVTGLACERGDLLLFEELSFRLGAGEALHVAGRNGAGKTSLLHLIAGLGWPLAGEIRWAGRDTRADPLRWRNDFTLIAHAPMLKDVLTPVANLRFALALQGQSVDAKRIESALETLGLAGCEDLPCRSLSAGQKRRVSLARLLLSSTPVWLLDEPLTALDVDGRAIIGQAIDRHLADGGLVIYTSHHPVPLADGARQSTLEIGR
ncbi:unnamed protein product, partial [Cyprideis torosa]